MHYETRNAIMHTVQLYVNVVLYNFEISIGYYDYTTYGSAIRAVVNS
jgi:hypothetical protein